MSVYLFNKHIKDLALLQSYLIKLNYDINHINYQENNLHIYTNTVLTTQQQIDLNQLLDNYIDISPVSANKLISQLNSTSELLTSNSVFNGQFEDISDYSTITISCISDTTSLINGLELCFSADGINIHEKKCYTIEHNSIFIDTITIYFSYFKIVYKNGPLNQTSFVIQSIAHLYKSKNISDTTQKNEVIIKQDFQEPNQIPTNGYFRIESLEMNCLANSTTTQEFSWPYPIGPTLLKLNIKEENIGDVINSYIASDTIIGVITSNITAGSSTLYMSQHTLSIIKPGFICKITDGVNTNDLGEVITINHSNLSVVVSNTTIDSFNIGAYIKITINNIKNLKFNQSGTRVLGDGRIGSTYLPANIIVTVKYQNNANVNKMFSWDTEYMY